MSNEYRKAYDRRADWSEADEAELLRRLDHDALPIIKDAPAKAFSADPLDPYADDLDGHPRTGSSFLRRIEDGLEG